MNVSLNPELEKLIERKVKSGMYNTASEVIREGLRLLEEADYTREMKRRALVRDIGRGVADIQAGRYTEYGLDELDNFKEDIIQTAKVRMQVTKKPKLES